MSRADKPDKFVRQLLDDYTMVRHTLPGEAQGILNDARPVTGLLHLFDKKRFFNEGRIQPQVVFLTLRDQRSIIIERSNDRFDGSTNSSNGCKSATPVDDAVSIRLVRGANHDRHLLTMLANAIGEIFNATIFQDQAIPETIHIDPVGLDISD